MIIFRISAQPDGWYVCTDAARSGPCLSRALAVERAEGMVEAIRAHGEAALVDASCDAGSEMAIQPKVTRALAS